MRKVFVRSAYNYDVEEASLESGLECKDDSLAIQSQAEEADINTIVKRFGVTGQLPQVSRLPSYEDFEGIFDYRSAMDAVVEADRLFMQVPAKIRARFSNDPAEFVAFCSAPGNLPELRRMGLAPEPAEVASTPSAPASSAVPAPGAAPTAPVTPAPGG